jgi:hypothetical protein
MITAQSLLDMFNYWLATPVNSVFGSSFGCDKSALFMQPLSAPIADKFISKLKADLPIFSQLSSEQLAVEVETSGFDVVMIYFRLGNVLIELGKPQRSLQTGETFDANAQ